MPILDAYGRPIGTAAPLDAPHPHRPEKALSVRAAGILREITLWEMTRQLSPTLICKACHERWPEWSDRDKTLVNIASTLTGSILAQCSCTAWVCLQPVPLDTSDIPAVAPELITLMPRTLAKKQRPIGTKEARLLNAWRQVMLDHQWFELLSCMECAKHDLNFCKCAVIPEKSVTIDCDCTERRWRGVTK